MNFQPHSSTNNQTNNMHRFHLPQLGARLLSGILAAVTVFLSRGSGLAQTTNAFDQAADATYSGGFFSGQNGGSGFGAWTISLSGADGSFIQTNGPSGFSFDIWNTSANTSTVAIRPFNSPLSVGQSCSVSLRMNNLDDSLATNAFALEDAAGNILFSYWHYGNETNPNNGWYGDATTNAGVAANFQYAFQQFVTFKFTLNSPTNYTFTDLATGASFTGKISNALISNAAFIRANGDFTPASGQDFQFDQLLVTTPVGSWASLVRTPPFGLNMCMLLGDGTVLGMNGDGRCARLTPDNTGSYRNGTWTQLQTMNLGRLFFASAVLTNGNVFVAGGEYGTGRRHAELFDPLNNVWTKIPDPLPGPAFSDAIGKILPGGNVLVAPVSQFGGNVIYNVASNNWQAAASTVNQNEVCWVKLPNDTILTIDTGAQTSKHYVPSLNQWITDGNVPVPVYGYGAEIGAGFLLPNGKVFYIGGSTNTAIYTPGATPTSAGSWVAGAPMVFGTNNLGAVDAPAAMMANGKILCDLGPVGGFNSPCFFYEYDYYNNSFTQVSAPGGGQTYNSVPYATSMLDLPSGQVLFVGGQNSSSLYLYTPALSPLAAGQPSINSISQNSDGTFHLTGSGLNGISEGAAYGDDEQMDSNYPLIRLTNNTSGLVYYARAFNRSSTSVMTGNRVLSTELELPQGLPAGTYSLSVVANGNPSAPTNFTYSPPAVPTGLVAPSGSNAFIKLSWNTSAGATAYNLKRSSKTNGYYATIATISGNTYTNFALTNGLAYFYKVSAIGSGGPSSDSSSVAATPAGPPILPGATNVNLSSYYNRTGITTDGRTFSGGGFDGGGFALSANQLGSSMLWNRLVFAFGPANAADVITCAGQTVTLPAGNFNSLQLIATAINGGQQNQTFAVTYSDNSTSVFSQSVSDWANPQSYQNENSIVRMYYRNTSGGGSQSLGLTLSAYVFPLDQTKTVKNIILPSNGNVIMLSAVLANSPISVALNSYYNRGGIFTDGTTFTNSTGIDGSGNALSGSLIGNSQTWTNNLFSFGPMNASNVISCANQTISLPAGKYSRLQFLGLAVNGNQTAQSFVVTYADATTATFSQSVSDWFSPQNYSGESKAVPMGYRNSSTGSSSENQSIYMYGYSLAVNGAKTIQSVRVPNNANVNLESMVLVPNWPPVFLQNPITLVNAAVGQSYSATIATNATDVNLGDTITFAKVSGPAWLNVAANGTLFGTPGNPNAGTNVFVVSVSDQYGASNTATISLVVTGATVYTLTYTAGANGDITGTSPQFVVYSNNAAPVTAVPDTGYYFTNWSDGVTDNPRTDNSVTNTITVTANFAPLTYSLTYLAGAGGSIGGTSPQTVSYGGNGTAVTAVADAGYAFTNWNDNSTLNPRSDTNINSNLAFTANFVFTGALPSNWSSNAEGALSAATGSTYSNGVFFVSGAGTNISGTADNFWLINQPVTNDATIIARVVSQDSINAAARAGVMLRESLSADARFVFIGLVPTNQVQWVRRDNSGGKSSATVASGTGAPYWLKLTRGTNVLNGYVSVDGVTWMQAAGVSIAMNSNCVIGLAVCSGSGSDLNTASFDNVSVTNVFLPAAVTSPAANPAVLGPLAIGTGAIQFQITGDTNTLWELQDSSDLQNWNPLQNIGLINGQIQQAEEDAVPSQRFLRLKSVP